MSRTKSVETLTKEAIKRIDRQIAELQAERDKQIGAAAVDKAVRDVAQAQAAKAQEHAPGQLQPEGQGPDVPTREDGSGPERAEPSGDEDEKAFCHVCELKTELFTPCDRQDCPWADACSQAEEVDRCGHGVPRGEFCGVCNRADFLDRTNGPEEEQRDA